MARLPRLPDLLTTANLACGVSSILFASQGQLTTACWLVFAGAFFDVLDGLAARALGGGTPLGAQLDSLADMVTFGVAPAMVVWFGFYGYQWEQYLWYADQGGPPVELGTKWPVMVAILALVVGSGWRLAKFNIDDRQTSGFLGLPTPANGLFWSASVLGASGNSMLEGPGYESLLSLVNGLLTTPYAMMGVCLGLAIFMLSEVPLPSFKFKHFKWQGNQVIYLLGIIGLGLILLYGMLAVPMILLLYLLSPLWGKLFPKQPA